MCRDALVVESVASLQSNDAAFVMSILLCGAVIVMIRTFAMSRCAGAASSFGHAPVGDSCRRLGFQIVARSVGMTTHGFVVLVHLRVCGDVSVHHVCHLALAGNLASHCSQIGQSKEAFRVEKNAKTRFKTEHICQTINTKASTLC